MNDNLEALIEKLAPARTGVNGIEQYNVRGLLARLGVDEEDLGELLDSGTLCPCGKGRKDVTGKDEIYPFRSDDLNALRRALVIEGLKAIAAEHEPEDSPEGERAFCRGAEFIFAMERRSEPKSRNPVTLCLAQGALSRAAGRVIELQEPVLRGRLAADRYRKKIQDEDLDRRDANLGRAGVAGAIAGSALRGKLKLNLIKRAALGAGVGVAGVLAVRKATQGTKDIYGDRSRGAKQAESLPAVGALGVAGYALLRRSKAKLRTAKSRIGFEIRRRPDGTLYDDAEEEQRPGFPVARTAAVVGAAGLLGHRGVVGNYGSYRVAAGNVIPDVKRAVARAGAPVAPVASALGQSLKKDVLAPLRSAAAPLAANVGRRIAPKWAKIRGALRVIGTESCKRREPERKARSGSFE